MKLSFAVLFLLISISGFSQKHTISGFVEDSLSGEKLIGVSIYDASTLAGTSSNIYGYYTITLPDGEINLIVSYIGYTQKKYNLKLDKDYTINISFNNTEEIEEVKIYGKTRQVDNTQMSAIEIQPLMIQNLPVFLGEKDVLKTIQLMPGVQAGTEGSSNFYVRGGAPDQNLILLDGVPVYNANHLFGFFSVFNPDAIQNVTLIKGGFPARYGGRLSSVLDIRLKEGNNKEFHGEGSVGIISSKIFLEGPLVKNKSSFMISARRTYIDILSQPFIKMANKDLDKFKAGYFFQDLNAKANYQFSDKDRIFLSVYTGKDKAYSGSSNSYTYDNIIYDQSEDLSLWWGNITAALRWNHVFSNNLFSNTTLTYSRYKFSTGIETYEKETDLSMNDSVNSVTNNFEYFSGINDVTGKIDFDYLPTPNHAVKFGTTFTYHNFHPGITALSISSQQSLDANIDTTFGNTDINALEYYGYIEDDITIVKNLKANLGLHYSGFSVNNSFYQSLQPRVALRYKLTTNMSIKAAYTQMTQYIHLLSNSNIGLPTDLWLPVTDRVKPQNSSQYAAGYVYEFLPGIIMTIEGFYKDMYKLIEYKEGASYFSIEDDWQDKIETGKGWAYGGEFLLEKKKGKTTGWVAYTLSWAYRQFDNISFGNPFPAHYDRRHDISIAFTHKFSDEIDIGVVWVYGTGNAVTLAYEKYPSAFNTVNPSINNYTQVNYVEQYASRNNYRMPAYHRLDVGINLRKDKKWGQRTWSVGLYNAYNRQNAFMLYFAEDTKNWYYDSTLQQYQPKKVLKQISLFPIIPFVSYSFKF